MSLRASTFLLALWILLWSALFFSQSLADLAAASLFVFALVHPRSVSRLWKDSLEIRTLVVLFAAWWAWVGFCYVVNGVSVSVAAPGFLEFRWMIEFVLWTALATSLLPEGDWVKRLTPAPLVSAVIGFTVMIVPILGGSPFTTDTRNGGVLQDPMSFAHNLGPAAVLFSALALERLRSKKNGWAAALGALALLAFTLTTQTRGVWSGVWLGLLAVLLFFQSPWRAKLIAAFVAGTLALALLPPVQARLMQVFDTKRSYDSERAVLWQANLDMVAEHPLTGVGYGENHRRLPEYFARRGLPENQFQGHAHNEYLQILAGTGFPGLFFFLAFLIFFLRWTWEGIRDSTGEERMFFAGLLGAQITFHIAAITESNFSIAKNRYLLLFLLTLALATRLRRRKKT